MLNDLRLLVDVTVVSGEIVERVGQIIQQQEPECVDFILSGSTKKWGKPEASMDLSARERPEDLKSHYRED